MNSSNNRKLCPTFKANLLKVQQRKHIFHYIFTYVTCHSLLYYMKSAEKMNVIPHISATSSELSPQSSSPSQTQKCSLQRELLHKNSSALHIFPPGWWKDDRKKTQENRKTKERTSVLDKTSTTTSHRISAANDIRSVTKRTSPTWKGWRRREKHPFKNLFLDRALLSLSVHDC